MQRGDAAVSAGDSEDDVATCDSGGEAADGRRLHATAAAGALAVAMLLAATRLQLAAAEPDSLRLPRPNRVHHPLCGPVSRTYMGPDASRLPAAGPVSTIGSSKRPMLGSGPLGS